MVPANQHKAAVRHVCASKRPSQVGRRARVSFEDGYERMIMLPGEGASNNAYRRASWGIENLRRRHGAITDLTVLCEVR